MVVSSTLCVVLVLHLGESLAQWTLPVLNNLSTGLTTFGVVLSTSWFAICYIYFIFVITSLIGLKAGSFQWWSCDSCLLTLSGPLLPCPAALSGAMQRRWGQRIWKLGVGVPSVCVLWLQRQRQLRFWDSGCSQPDSCWACQPKPGCLEPHQVWGAPL